MLCVDLITIYKADRYWFSFGMKYYDFVTKWCPYQDLITPRLQMLFVAKVKRCE